MRPSLCVLGLLAPVGAPVLAAPSALVQIPTTDVIAKHNGYADFATAAYAGATLTAADLLQENQVGLGHHAEIGCDYPVDGFGRCYFNLKWELRHEGATRVALGVSAVPPFDLTTHFVYLIGSHRHGKWRVHLGAAESVTHWHGLAGLEYVENDHLTLMSDRLSGKTGASSLGFNWTFGDPDHLWGLMVGAIHDNVGGGNALYVNFGKSYSF